MNMLENIMNNVKGITNNLDNAKSLGKKQENFLETTLGQVINTAIDFGIKAVLPSWLEDDFIEIKNSIFNDGFKSGVQMAINKAINLGKSIEGIFTGNFESISQIKTVIKSGGLLDTISKLLDNVITWAKDEKIINSSTAKLIKSSKNTILDNIEKSIDSSLENQVAAIEKIDEYIEKWKGYFEEQDLTNMKKIHTRIKNTMEELIPIQDVLNKVEQLENMQKLIENNGGQFSLTEEEIELTQMLV